jgi:hypothetical protein
MTKFLGNDGIDLSAEGSKPSALSFGRLGAIIMTRSTLCWDIETRSAANLRDCGSYIYAIDPTTKVLCLSYAIEDGDPQLWLRGVSVPSVFFEVAINPNDRGLVAHQYGFERDILENILIPQHGFPSIPLETQHCTQPLGAGERLST